MTQTIQVQRPSESSLVIDTTLRLLQRQVRDRSGVEVTTEGEGTPDLVLSLRPGIGEQGYTIEDGEQGGVRIVGNDENGLLYGVGKFLRTSRYGDGEFVPSGWRGTAAPEKEIRGIYFASHFHNFYHDAPIEEVQRYVEELALWGTNSLQMWYDMHHFNGIDDPAAQAMIERLHAILKAAKSVGMLAGLVTLANEAYANSPEELRAPSPNRAHYRVELCPKEPGASELMLKWFDEEFQAFSDLQIDCLWIWPYDQGGCACEKCKPWGANGFLCIGEQTARLFRRHFPNGKVILSTWLFDYQGPEGEWPGLAKAFEQRPDWVDYILADSHTTFPEYPLKHGVPGGLPMLSFPEISMWGMWPWGGFGANPLPKRFQELWDGVGSNLSGGWPYSEGIFEDINKTVMSQFYWEEGKSATETLREYVAFEYSPDVVDDVLRAIETLEQNHRHVARSGDASDWELNEFADAEECVELLERADARLTTYAKRAWRWRILLLRAQIDLELKRNDGVPNEACEAALQELTKIYHAEGAQSMVAPPVSEAKGRR